MIPCYILSRNLNYRHFHNQHQNKLSHKFILFDCLKLSILYVENITEAVGIAANMGLI